MELEKGNRWNGKNFVDLVDDSLLGSGLYMVRTWDVRKPLEWKDFLNVWDDFLTGEHLNSLGLSTWTWNGNTTTFTLYFLFISPFTLRYDYIRGWYKTDLLLVALRLIYLFWVLLEHSGQFGGFLVSVYPELSWLVLTALPVVTMVLTVLAVKPPDWRSVFSLFGYIYI